MPSESTFIGKTINAKRLSISSFKGSLLNILRWEIARNIVRDFEKTTATWVDKPTFETEIKYKAGNIEVRVYPDEYSVGSEHWQHLNEDDFKDVEVSPDWESKTAPRWFGSEKGSGEWWWADRSPMEPREWTDEAQEIYGEKMVIAVNRLIRQFWRLPK